MKILTKQSMAKAIRALYCCLILTGTTACLFFSSQSVPQLNAPVTEISLDAQDYWFAVWVNHRTLALIQSESSNNREQRILNSLLIYDLDKSQSEVVHLDLSEDCDAARLTGVKRLLPGQIALTLRCYFHNRSGERFADRIIIRDITNNTERILRQYSPGIRTTDFAFSPDLTEGLQERTGDGIYNRLYHVDEDGVLEQLLEDYSRVGAPDWSPDGQQIAFAATAQMPQEQPNLFTGLLSIDNAVRQYWTIYIAQPDLSDMQVALKQITGVRQIRWSPDGQFLAFNAAKYQGKPGIFVLNLKNREAVQLWDEDTEFDWSPSGQQMLLLTAVEMPNTDSLMKPLVLDISKLYQ